MGRKQQQQQQQTREPMSYEEIRQLTRKNYERLPEVKERETRERDQLDKKLNRYRSSIYKRTIQQHVLNAGPNFHMSFKAFKDL